MRFDALAVSRHRWFVVMIMMVGGLMILLAGGNYYLLREHIASIDPSRYGAEGKRLVEELDLRMAMGTAVMVCFILGVFLFFVGVAVDISFRQKAMINFILRSAVQARTRSQAPDPSPDPSPEPSSTGA